MREKFEVRNLQQSTFCGKKYAVACPVFLRFLCCVFWEAPSDRCSCLAALTAFPVSTACFRSISTGVWQDQQMHPTNPTPRLCCRTWPCRWWRRAAITLSRPLQGAEGSTPLLWLRQGNMQLWPPKELPFSLWHALRRSIIPLFSCTPPPSPVGSVFTGAC